VAGDVIVSGLDVPIHLIDRRRMAPAQVTVDVSKITCDEFVKYKIADPKQIAIWISGYYHGTHRSSILDTQGLLQAIDNIEEYCFQHPDALVMKAVEENLGAQ
jgi:acid stress chaperone HdeB